MERLCRFCLECKPPGGLRDALLQPCDCSGTQGDVHASCLFKWQREQLSNGISAGTCTTCRKEYHLPLAHWKAVYDEQSAFQIYSNAADARKLRRPVKTAAAHQQPAPVPAAPAQQRVADATHLALCRELACRAALAAGRLVCMHSPARQVLSVGLLLLVLETRRDV